MDSIVIKGNGSVTIRDLNSSESKILIEKIHNKFFSGKKLYCNGIIPLTPEKEAPGSPEAAAAPAATTPSMSGPPSATPTLPTPISPISPQFSKLNDIGTKSIIPETPDPSMLFMSNFDLLKRHSLSLRSPPNGSLAAEILGKDQPPSNLQLEKVKAMMSDVREALTDFDSCVSSGSDDDSSKSPAEGGWQSHRKRKKSKSMTPPSRDYFLKKQNIGISPSQSS